MASAAQDYVSWLIEDAIVDEELSPHLQRHIDADNFFSFHIGSKKYAIHLEFQTLRHKQMARRM
jgi:hypothetical protein